MFRVWWALNLSTATPYYLPCEVVLDKIELLPHQVDAKKKFDQSGALLLYHGLGSGKTITSIASTLDGGVVDAIVPASLRENFKKELSKFTPKSKYNIKSYHAFLKNPDVAGDTVILDEPQKIGRTSSGISQALVDAASKYNRRILLSGTPASNNPAELAPIIKFLNPGSKIPLNPSEFNKRFIKETTIPVGFWNKLRGVKDGVEQTIQNESDIINAIKNRVHYHNPPQDDYPSRKDHIVKVEASPEQVDYYSTVTSQANPILAFKIKRNLPLSKQDLSQMNAFMGAARQVSNTTTPYGGLEELSPKMITLINKLKGKIDTDKDHKSVVYSNYLGAGVVPIAKKLSDLGISNEVFTGVMSDKQKAEVVRKYNNNEISTLLLSGAGAEGIDLKGTGSIHILEPHWNKNKIEQVIGRGVRYKSHIAMPEEKRSVDVYKYQTIMPKTLTQRLFGLDRDTSSDEALENLSEKKQLLLDKFLTLFKNQTSL